MAKVSKNAKKQNNKKNEKYNADNEIIIGVTTKPKEKVRVEKKATRTNQKNKKKEENNKKNKNCKNLKKNNVKKKQVVKNKIKTEKDIKKLNRKRVLISIVILLFLMICGTIYYLTTPVFNVSNIIVYGNEKNSTDTYISLSKININETNIFAFTNSSINKKLRENPYVEDVEIKRKLPNTLELHITERSVDYQISYSNTYVYLNNQGYLLERSEEKKDVTVIKGLSAVEDNIQVGQRVSNEDLIKLDTVLKIVNYCKYNSIESNLTSIDVTDISNYTIIFEEEGKMAYLGDSSSITEKMTAVANILKAEKGKEGIIHANEDKLKRNRVYFSEKELRLEE